MKISFRISAATIALAMAITANVAHADNDGAAAAKLGTIVHNELNPDKPLPIHNEDGKILHDTATNMGAGMSVKDAFDNAAEKETHIPDAKPSNDSTHAPDREREHIEHDHVDHEIRDSIDERGFTRV